jgi:hypothetical protein
MSHGKFLYQGYNSHDSIAPCWNYQLHAEHIIFVLLPGLSGTASQIVGTAIAISNTKTEKVGRRSGHAARSPGADHLTISTSLPRRVISIQDPHLLPAFIASAESVATLLPHPLHLAYLPDRLLKLLHSRPVILHIVLLDFLYVMVGLWVIHTFGVLPGKVAHQAERRQKQDQCVEHRRGEHDGNDALELSTEAFADFGCNHGVDGEEDQPDYHRSWNGHKSVLGPDVRDQGCLAQDNTKDCSVERRAPQPVTAYLAI